VKARAGSVKKVRASETGDSPLRIENHERDK